MLLLGQLGVQIRRVGVRLQGDVQTGLQDKAVSSRRRGLVPKWSLLTAEAVMKLVNVLLSDGSTFPATTSSEPLKYLSKRFWVTSDTESSGNWMAIRLRRGAETWR